MFRLSFKQVVVNGFVIVLVAALVIGQGASDQSAPVEAAYGGESIVFSMVSGACNPAQLSVSFSITGLDPALPYRVVAMAADSSSNVNPNPMQMWREFVVPGGHPSTVLFSNVVWAIYDASPLLTALGQSYTAAPLDFMTPNNYLYVNVSLYHPSTGVWLGGQTAAHRCSDADTVLPLEDGRTGFKSAQCYAFGVGYDNISPECTTDIPTPPPPGP